ncbi:MAG TPA: sugar phosphate nucleotidyltransferase [Candidatus Binatia bacterium]|jgi:mannose-1-phosphate guanylyltransferase
MKRNLYAVIMAGGKGTRFWPLSRPQRPKQLLKLLSAKSLIRETVERVEPLFGRRNTLIVTVDEHHRPIRVDLPMLPKANFLVEPQGNNTAPCIGLAAVELVARNPEAIMAVLPADHWVADARSFSRTLRAALQLAARREELITLGIPPAYPETGYGYILRGKKTASMNGRPAYRVAGFVEKPERQKAARLIRRGALWNSGIFIWRASTILKSLERYAPQVAGGLERIRAIARGRALATLPPKAVSLVRREYRKMPNVSIDYAVLEKAGSAGQVATLEADFGWSDVGNWDALHRMLPKDGGGNAGIGRWVSFRSNGCLAYSNQRLITLLGMQNTVVVDTPDAVLVADMSRAQEVKDLLEELRRKGYRRHIVR